MAEYRIPLGYVRGPAGTAGKDFEFKKTYATVAAMNADFSGTDTSTGDYVLISAGVDDADNGRMYRKGESTWIYVARINGPTGATGQRGPMPPLVTDLNVTIPGEGALDAAVGPRIAERLIADGGDAAENVVTFTSSDTDETASITSFETMPVFATGTNRLKALFATLSKAVKNIRLLIKQMGTTDISGINNGTVTDILSNLNTNKFDKANVLNVLNETRAGYALDARQGRALSTSINSLNDALATTNNSVANINSHWWHMTNVSAPSGYKAVQVWFNANTVAPIFYSDTSGNCFVIAENWGSIGSTLYSVPKITINSSGSNSANVYAAKSGSNIRLKFSFASSIPMGGLFNTDGTIQFRNQEFLDA